MNEFSLIAEFEDFVEEGKVPPLLDPALFSQSDKIYLPYQVNPITEGSLKNILWHFLERFNPQGEVILPGFGKIDLVCDYKDFMIGIECKKEFVKNIKKKDLNYMNSQSLNALYLASFGINDYELSLDYLEAKINGREPILELLRRYTFAKNSIDTRGMSFEEGIYYRKYEGKIRYQEELEETLKKLREKYQEGMVTQFHGVIMYNPLGEIWLARGASLLGGTKNATCTPTKEAFIAYSVWRYLKDRDYIVAVESILPGAVKYNTRSIRTKTRYTDSFILPRGVYIEKEVERFMQTGHYRIDITAMPKDNIFIDNSSQYEIIGVECKVSLNNRVKLIEQLRAYLHSGSVSRLYLAIPHKLKNKAKSILTQAPIYDAGKINKLTDIGILAVDEHGEVEEIKPANQIELKEENMPLAGIEKRRLKEGYFKERLYLTEVRVL